MDGKGDSEDELSSMSKDDLIKLVRQLRDPLGSKQADVVAAPEKPAPYKKKKQPREFDMSRYNQRHVALKIAYLGANYKGFAAQESVADTVEAVLFDALKKVRLITSRETSNYTRSGRTDKGVSAFGQVIGINLRSNMKSGLGVLPSPADAAAAAADAADANAGVSDVGPASTGGAMQASPAVGSDAASSDAARPVRPFTMPKIVPTDVPGGRGPELPYVAALNAALPPDIRVLAWAPVPAEFNARFSTRQRIYKYFFLGGTLDIDRMRQGAARLVGEHDFRNFCRIDVVSVNNFVRRITSFEILPVAELASAEPSKQLYQMIISGTAFLWHQVRAMAAILFLVGQRLEEPSIITEMLDVEKHSGKPSYQIASDAPLVLWDCQYENLEWSYARDAQEKVFRHFLDLWQEQMIKTQVIGSMLRAVETADVRTESGQTVPFSSLKLDTKGPAYVPLLKRPREASVAEKTQTLSSSKRARLEHNLHMRHSGGKLDPDQQEDE